MDNESVALTDWNSISAIKKTKFQNFQENELNWKCYITVNKSRAQTDRHCIVSLLHRAQLQKVVGAGSVCNLGNWKGSIRHGERLEERQERRESVHAT